MQVKDILIREHDSIPDALRKLDKTANKVLLVVDGDNRFIGTLSDGDIRRYILQGKSIDNEIRGIFNRNPSYITAGEYSIESARKLLLGKRIDLVPIVDAEMRVVDFITWKDAFSEKEAPGDRPRKISAPIVIMAGGKGSRLEPFTKILPKPLIPIGEKPMIEHVIDEFRKQGAAKYYLTLNYKGEIIESYFNNIQKDYDIAYVKETDYRGTAGCLKMLGGEIRDDFIVSNCDVIVKADLAEVVNFHVEGKAILTVLSSVQYYKIPYGVIKIVDGGNVAGIVEKPEYSFTVNTGVYIVNREAIEHIPEQGCFDMTDLIKALIERGKKVMTYPVNENEYIDIGQWEEYKKAIEKLRIYS